MCAVHLDQLRVLRSDLPCRTSLPGCCVLVYDHEQPTVTCKASNGSVRSSPDNASPARAVVCIRKDPDQTLPAERR